VEVHLLGRGAAGSGPPSDTGVSPPGFTRAKRVSGSVAWPVIRPVRGAFGIAV
jgi:hypothetical protein